MRHKQIKELIELASSYEKADEIIEKHAGLNSYAEKIAYLKEMFGCEIISRNIESEEADYFALLASIVHSTKKA